MSKVGKFLDRVNKGEVEKRKAKERQQEQLMELAVDAGMTYATRGTNKIGSGAAPKAAPTPKKAKGGKADSIEYKKVFDILKENIDDTVEDLYSTYEGSERAEGEEVESKSRDGFIPYTNGGYYSRWFEYSNQLEGSGIGLPTKSLDDKIEEFRENNREYARERFEEDYPEIVQELGIENIEYGSLYDAGYSDEAEELDEYERDDDSVMMEIQALYYSPDNDRAEDGKHTIRLSGVVNLEAPYHRTGNLEDFIEKTFTFSSYKDLEDKLEKGLSEVLSWFEGDMYSKKSRELKIRRMAKGGEAKKDDKFIQKAVAEMEKKGTKGAFTKKANRQDMSVKQFTKEVLDNPSEYDLKTRRQAQFVKNVTKYEWGGKVDTGVGVSDTLNKAYEYAKGGIAQGYSKFKVLYIPYSGKTQEKMFDFYSDAAKYYDDLVDDEKGGGTTTIILQGYTDDYDEFEDIFYFDPMEMSVQDEDEDFAKGGEIQDFLVLHTEMKPEDFIKKHNLSKYEYEIDENDYDDFSRINFETYPSNYDFVNDKSVKEFYFEPYEEYAKGGTMKKQGYNDKLDESLSMRKGKASTKKQSDKDRRDESKGMEKAMGRRAYESVGTMDKMDKGGSVEFETRKKFKLTPIGDIAFVFDSKSRRKGKRILVRDVDIIQSNRHRVSEADNKRLMKEMRKKGSDLLTDGTRFYTTFGTDIGEIKHPQFKKELELDRELYGSDFDKGGIIVFAKGGKTQGYNAKLDESLGNRKGKESTKKQSLKDRRDESKGEEKALGKRAYSSVSSMDKLLPFLSWHKK